MDRTGIIIVSLCAALLIIWMVEWERTAAQQAQYAATHPVSVAQSPAQTEAPTTTTTTPATPITSISTEILDTSIPENLMVVTNGRARYTFTSRGGGLQRVDLLDFPETISARWKKINADASSGVASLNTRAPLPILAIIGDTNLMEMELRS